MSATLQALTANNLRSGEVVFRTADGWSGRFAEAQLFSDPLAAREDDKSALIICPTTQAQDRALLQQN